MPNRRRRLDQRTLHPHDYLVNPWQFGWIWDAAARTPAGGDDRSHAVAVVQHRVACLIRDRDDRYAARSVTEQYGFSKQYWSLCLQGDAWMGETVLAAAVGLILDRP